MTRAAIILLAAALLTGCSKPEDQLAVAKMPESQLQATAFLPLNDDKPGTPLTVRKYLVPGKYTIVYYYSPYSDPSENFQQALAQLVQTRPDLAVRTININRPEVVAIDWDSPVVKEANLNALPYFFIFDPRQDLRAHGRPAHEQVRQWCQPVAPTY